MMEEQEDEDEYSLDNESSDEIFNPFIEGKKRPKKRKYKSKKEKEIDAENSLIFWRAVLKSVTGRREIWELLDSAKAFDDRFGCGPNGFPNAQATWFHAGEKAFGLKFYYKMMAIDPESIILMHKENDPRIMK